MKDLRRSIMAREPQPINQTRQAGAKIKKNIKKNAKITQYIFKLRKLK